MMKQIWIRIRWGLLQIWLKMPFGFICTLDDYNDMIIKLDKKGWVYMYDKDSKGTLDMLPLNLVSGELMNAFDERMTQVGYSYDKRTKGDE